MSSIPKARSDYFPATCLGSNHVSFLLRWWECLKTLNWWIFNTEWVLFPASILPLWPQWGKKGESYFREGAGYDAGESPSDRRGSRRKPSTAEDRSGTCGGREPGHIRLLANSPRHSPVRLKSGRSCPSTTHRGNGTAWVEGSVQRRGPRVLPNLAPSTWCLGLWVLPHA